MAKKATRNTLSGNEKSIEIQQTHVEDDSLLPSPEEISKYHAIDPTIIPWLKERAEKEQEFRHKTTLDKLEVVSKNEASTRSLNKLGLNYGFIIMMVSMACSFSLIVLGHEIKGSVFLGSTVIVTISIFITRNAPKKDQTKP